MKTVWSAREHLRRYTPRQVAHIGVASQLDWHSETAGTLADTHKTERETQLEQALIVH